LHFVDEVDETPKLICPITRLAAKILHVPTLHTQFLEPIAKGMDKERVYSREKDKIIGELQYELKEAQQVIAKSYYENMEMKRKLVEMVSNIQTP